MRRGFLNYVERERAHPYRTFLHYNSWYDIGYGKPYDAAAVLDVINAFGTELVRRRNVKLDSFLLDDGWDNPRSIWHMNAGFPEGLTPVNHAAQEYGAAVGIWLSPWGGYEEAKQQRLDFGQKYGFETNAGGFALSGPKYYARFREVSLDFIQKDGINQFKIDGTGNVDSVFPGSGFDSDFAAAIRLIEDWARREAGPLRQPHHWNLSLTVLVALCGLYLARRRRPQLCWSRQLAREMDHVQGRTNLSEYCASRSTLSLEFPHAAWADLCQAGRTFGQRPGK
jgi:hypothetical protein